MFPQVLEEFKIAAEAHAQNLQNSVLSIKHKTDHVRNELDTVQNIFEGIHAITREKSRTRVGNHSQTSSSLFRSRYNPINSKHGGSGFDSKIEKFKKSAEDRKSQNRSGSHNAVGHSQSDAKNSRLLQEKVSQLEIGFNNI
jgi:hypothetical protein